MKYARSFWLLLFGLSLVVLTGRSAVDPWPDSALMQPAALAAVLQDTSAKPPAIVCTAFPVLYKSKHITGAVFAGPGSKPEGIEALKKSVASMRPDSEIVLYCGCCPMDRCPNIRPAYQILKQMGFTNVRVLNIPVNMHTDWYSKNYPSEAGPAGTAETAR